MARPTQTQVGNSIRKDSIRETYRLFPTSARNFAGTVERSKENDVESLFRARYPTLGNLSDAERSFVRTAGRNFTTDSLDRVARTIGRTRATNARHTPTAGAARWAPGR